MLGLPVDKVNVHVMQGGGSFGRKLFFDAALEAAEISQKMGKPVKLMWHRTDDSRVGRVHPMARSRIRATYARRRGADLRAAPHQRRDRQQPRPRRDHHRAQRRAPGRQDRLRPDDLRADPGGALQLRRRRPAPQRDRRAVQHRQHAQHLLPRRVRRPRARHRPAGRERCGKDPYEFRREFLKRRPDAAPCSSRSPRPAAGAGRCRRARRRASRSTRSTRASTPAWSRSTAGRAPSSATSATPSPVPGSPRS